MIGNADNNQPGAEGNGTESRGRYPSRRSDRKQRRRRQSRVEQPQRPATPSSTTESEGTSINDYWQEDNTQPAPGQEPHRTVTVRKSAQARSRRRARRRHRRLIALIVIVVLALVLGAGAVISIRALGGVNAVFSAGEDYDGEGTGTVYVQIPKGATGQQIGKILEEQGVIKSADTFASVFKKNSLAQGVQAGRFEMRLKMSAKAALSRLLDPEARVDRQVTIPEGFTVKQIKERLVKASGFDQTAVDQAFSNPAAYGISATGDNAFEGWLGASSYTIDDETKVSDLVKQMVDYQIKVLDEAGVAEGDRERVLTEASIIEREVNQDQYYAQVARVILNRSSDNSETHGLLQMDSSVLYGVGKTGGIPTKEDLANDNPYNTYKYKGLPPTPIGSPGVKAIKAAVNPAEGNWLYFVTVNLDTGETKFASTLAEQKANVEEFKTWCSQEENKDKCSSK